MKTEIWTDIVIVGSGAGGATLAKELSKKGKKVLVLEKGRSVKKIGSEKAIFDFFTKDRQGIWNKSKEGVIAYRTMLLGGTTVFSCGNGVRSLEKEFREMGIDLSKEFEETEREMGVKPLDNKLIGKGTRRIMDAAGELGFKMKPMPKFINSEKCVSCGNCTLGCRVGAKWTPLEYLEQAENNGATILPNVTVKEVLISDGRTKGVRGVVPRGEITVFAKIVILAAGGIGTPIILQNSGIKEAGNGYFVDLFNVTYGTTKETINFQKEVTMGAVNHEHYESDGFILSPFIDPRLSFVAGISSSRVRDAFRRKRMLGIMVKINDEAKGKVNKDGTVKKTVTPSDLDKLEKGASISKAILKKAGIDPKSIVTTRPRGAHPGGTAAIGSVVDKNQETRIKGLFVSDASVLPIAPGLPPIVTIIALSKRLANRISALV